MVANARLQWLAEKMKMMDTNHAGKSDGRPKTSILIGEDTNGGGDVDF